MVAETLGISNAVGKGFDSIGDAQAWCDAFILGNSPQRIADLRAEVDDLVVELAATRSHM